MLIYLEGNIKGELKDRITLSHEEVVLSSGENSKSLFYTVNLPEEFEERLKNKDPFVLNVLREPKIMFIGDLHGLG